MIAKLMYEVECPQDCDKEDFLKWLEFHYREDCRLHYKRQSSL